MKLLDLTILVVKLDLFQLDLTCPSPEDLFLSLSCTLSSMQTLSFFLSLDPSLYFLSSSLLNGDGGGTCARVLGLQDFTGFSKDYLGELSYFILGFPASSS